MLTSFARHPNLAHSSLQKDKYDNSMTDYWGKFQVAQSELADAYSGNAEAGRVIGTA